MNPIELKPTNTTPAIVLQDDKLLIKGRSIPLSEAKFYDPYIEWAKDCRFNHLYVDINLEYMNSSSSKKLLFLLKTLDGNPAIRDLTITWYFESGDDELKDQGRLFEKLMKHAHFRYVKYGDNS
jgi:hypothetical protein